MRHLITYERFNYNGKMYVELICNKSGISLEEIEDIFLEFSEEGDILFHPSVKNGNLQNSLQVTIYNIGKELTDSEWLYNEEWEDRLKTIGRRLNLMGCVLTLDRKNLSPRGVILTIHLPKNEEILETYGFRQPTKLTLDEGSVWEKNHEKAEWTESEFNFYDTLTRVNARDIYDSVMWETLMRFYLYPVNDSDELDHLEIQKFEDSYYLIWHHPADIPGTFYLCDEWEEVLSFLGRYTIFRF